MIWTYASYNSAMKAGNCGEEHKRGGVYDTNDASDGKMSKGAYMSYIHVIRCSPSRVKPLRNSPLIMYDSVEIYTSSGVPLFPAVVVMNLVHPTCIKLSY
jgi:hypothetical protein